MSIYRGPGGSGDAVNDSSSEATLVQQLATEAQASADAAATSETNAANSASTASTAATNAQTAETNAETAETNAETAQAAAESARNAAQTAKTAAETAETNAETAETNAETAASAASTSATNAASSASSASTSASTATTQATNASNSASAASTSATNASNSASAASTSATNAASSATSASGSATSATSSASAASTSASNAATSATSAGTSASTATTQAGIATTKASEAATSATNAATSATNAASSATAASGSATTASTAATAAAASYDSFDDRYLGAKSTAPTVDNDGNTLLIGALYFNTVSNFMKVWDGSSWLDSYASLSGALLAANNLSDLTNTSTARTNLGLGTIATQAASSVAITGGAIDGTTVGATTASSGKFTSLSDSGNLTFTGTGNRILGDFSNATLANRVAFQSSTTNGNTALVVLPNGTSQVARFQAYNNSDPTNASQAQFSVETTSDVRLSSGITGTGTYLPLTMYTGGSERLRIDTSGNVGIGTSVPNTKLAVVTSTTNAGILVNDGTVNTIIYNSSGGVSSLGTTTNHPLQIYTNNTAKVTIDTSGNVGIGVTPSAGLGALQVTTGINGTAAKLGNGAFVQSFNGDGYYSGSASLDSSGVWTARSTGSSTIGALYTGNLLFYTNSGLTNGSNFSPTERMRIDSSGNVGIGTSAPTQILEVSKAGSGTTTTALSLINPSGNSTGSGVELRMSGNSITARYAYIQAVANSGANGHGLIFGTNAAASTPLSQFSIDSTGNLASRGSFEIGALASVNQDITIDFHSVASGATDYETRIARASGANGGFDLYNTGTGNFTLTQAGAAPMLFSTSNTERMRIDSSGNLLVGTTSNTVGGASCVSVISNTFQFQFGIGLNSTQTTGIGYYETFAYNGTQVGSITYNGTLTVYATTSDYRLKNVVGTVEGAGQRIDAVQPIEYDLKTGGRVKGFLAHQFAEVYPNSVVGEKDAVDSEGNPIYQTMQASSAEVMADLIAEIQSLRKRVAQLESK